MPIPAWFKTTCVAVSMFGVGYAVYQSRTTQPPPREIPTVAAQLDEGVRPIYPFSIIDGGAYSSTEVAQALRNDPLVAEHYADVNVQRLRAIRMARARSGYVSYRIGDKTFWTKQPVPVHEGEVVLTDGRTKIRARTGGKISDKPMSPVNLKEPSISTLDTPRDDVLVLAAGASVDAVTGSAQATLQFDIQAEPDENWWSEKTVVAGDVSQYQANNLLPDPLSRVRRTLPSAHTNPSNDGLSSDGIGFRNATGQNSGAGAAGIGIGAGGALIPSGDHPQPAPITNPDQILFTTKVVFGLDQQRDLIPDVGFQDKSLVADQPVSGSLEPSFQLALPAISRDSVARLGPDGPMYVSAMPWYFAEPITEVVLIQHPFARFDASWLEGGGIVDPAAAPRGPMRGNDPVTERPEDEKNASGSGSGSGTGSGGNGSGTGSGGGLGGGSAGSGGGAGPGPSSGSGETPIEVAGTGGAPGSGPSDPSGLPAFLGPPVHVDESALDPVSGPVPVPEPSMLVLVGIGAVLILVGSSRRKPTRVHSETSSKRQL